MTGNANLLKVFLAHCPIVQLKKSTGVELSKVRRMQWCKSQSLSDFVGCGSITSAILEALCNTPMLVYVIE